MTLKVKVNCDNLSQLWFHLKAINIIAWIHNSQRLKFSAIRCATKNCQVWRSGSKIGIISCGTISMWKVSMKTASVWAHLRSSKSQRPTHEPRKLVTCSTEATEAWSETLNSVNSWTYVTQNWSNRQGREVRVRSLWAPEVDVQQAELADSRNHKVVLDGLLPTKNRRRLFRDK